MSAPDPDFKVTKNQEETTSVSELFGSAAVYVRQYLEGVGINRFRSLHPTKSSFENIGMEKVFNRVFDGRRKFRNVIGIPKKAQLRFLVSVSVEAGIGLAEEEINLIEKLLESELGVFERADYVRTVVINLRERLGM